jgi:hypothetical protein
VTVARRPATGLLRALRAMTLVLSAVGIAVAAHAAVDGCVDLPSGAVVVALCGPAGWIVTRHELSFRTLLGWLVAVQIGAHLVLTALCGGPVLVHSLAVLGSHAGAVVITAGLLRGGDAAVWTADVIRRARGYVLKLITAVAVPVVSHLRVFVQAPLEALICSMWRGLVPIRRGPPAAAAAS